MIPAGMAAEKLPHTEDPGGIRTRRRQPVHVLVVPVVHHHDHVEFPEILLADMPGTVRQVIAAARRRPPHARIGQFARVPGIRSGRVDRNLRPEPAFADYVPHDSVGSRGTADIPQTNEKYLCFHGDKDSARREECQIYRVVPCRRPSKKRRAPPGSPDVFASPRSRRACNPGKPGLIPCRAITRSGPAEKAQAGAAAVILPAGT